MNNIIIQNQPSMSSTSNQKIFGSMRGILTGAMMMILTMTALNTQAQGCGNAALVCNNLVRVSLDTSCMVLITPDVVLKDLNIDTSLYRVEVRDPQGNLIPGNLIMDDYDGAKLEVRVYCKVNGLYCWGNIIIEDKIKPVLIIEPIDTVVSCIVMPFELDPNSLVTKVTFHDYACPKPDSLGITDFKEFPFPCQDTVKIIRRIWSIVDAAGNRCDTTQWIYLLKGKLNQIIFPKDTVIDCLDEADLSPAKLGEPQIGSCDHFEISMNDVEIPVCGVARKILRRWRITDTCDNQDTIVTQVIKIEDNHAPDIILDNFDIPIDKVVTDKFNCFATVRGINNPQIKDCNLAQTILRIFYQLTDANGNLIGQLFTATVNDMLSDPDDPNTATMIWDLIDVPVGVDFKVIFVADDQCGNIARDTSDIFRLPDTAPPNAVCEGNTIVVLNSDGVTEVLAETFDDNSFDNCGIVDKKVRRFNSSCPGYASDQQFSDLIHFCCDDIVDNPVKVVFRVFDGSGGFSDCIVNVFVQDKRNVSLTCGSDLRFNCGIDSAAVAQAVLDNPPSVTWICGEKSLTPDIPSYVEDECGGAHFTVFWTAMDLNGTMANCVQEVWITNLVDATVTEPDLEITLASCANGTHPDEIPNSRPIINDVDCENIAATWEDTPMEATGDVCMKIIRTWSIIDWCKFDGGNLESALLGKFDQTILISDNVDPVIECPDTGVIVDDNNNSCDEQVSLSISATDDCTPTDGLIITYQIDEDNDTSIESSGAGSALTHTFPVGIHKVIFTVEDACGNMAICEIPVTVISDKAPLPLCVGLVEAIIGDNGTATLTAQSLNVKSTTGCTLSEEGLSFSFSETQAQPERQFTCSDIPNGVFAEEIVEVWVKDDATGAQASCTVIISISDRQNEVCADNISSSAFSGFVTDEDQAVVKEIPVMVENMSTGEIVSTMTDEDGFFSFNDLEATEVYRVNPQFEDYPLAGISTLDIVLIQQHILGLRRLDSPYKLHAADVNNTNSISAIDLVGLRLLILGKRDNLPEDNWKFFDKDFEFDNIDPWTTEDHIMIENAGANENNLDFIGVKVGDVTGNAFIAVSQGIAGPRSTTVMNVTGKRTGDIVRYSFSADQSDKMIGMQLAIELASNMQLVVLGSDNINISEEHFSQRDNELRISWTNNNAINIEDEEIFFIDVRYAGSDVQKLALANRSLNAELYDEDLEGTSIVLNNIAEAAAEELQLLQNQPNPFTDLTKVSFYLPENGSVDFSITDINGKLIYKSTNLYNKGINIININSADLGYNGVYYYTVTTATSKATKRMILLH